MPIPLFRPHSISIKSTAGESYDESTGDFSPGNGTWSCHFPCRYEPNGKARTIPVGEGKNYMYEYTVYLNTDCPEIRFGQRIRLYDRCGNLKGEYSAKGFHRGQLDSKLWV